MKYRRYNRFHSKTVVRLKNFVIIFFLVFFLFGGVSLLASFYRSRLNAISPGKQQAPSNSSDGDSYDSYFGDTPCVDVFFSEV